MPSSGISRHQCTANPEDQKIADDRQDIYSDTGIV